MSRTSNPPVGFRSLAGIALAATFVCGPAGAAPLTVTSVDDSGPGTLREAITNANVPGPDNIVFDIPGSGVHTISLASALPTIEDGDLVIDGYTQPGAQANTAESGSNAVILIELDGAAAGADTLGLGICAPDVTVKGLAIRGFGVAGIGVGFTTLDDACKQGAADRAKIYGNFIGLQANGEPDGNESFGIRVWDSLAQIGDTLAERNVIADNGGYGIELRKEGVKDTLVVGNVIGFNPDLSKPYGHKEAGVALLDGAAGVTIGTEKVPNRIANNSIGIEVADTASVNRLYANDIGPDADIDIDLCPVGIICPEGATPNDKDDEDAGGNGVQNSPEITKLSVDLVGVTAAGTLDVPAPVSGLDYTIALYWSRACAGVGIGPGEILLGSATANLTDTSGEDFEVEVLETVPGFGVITATATSPDGETSEFSACQGLPGIFGDSFETPP